ncbi:hypothetical protein ACFHYQ_20295 [Sphaerimonospora cavernae]|uniref:Phage protein n=1 Tax=Sphaerimonospora cavernae TaxID=1740611 RepID=A0ABV6U854_9ACTN
MTTQTPDKSISPVTGQINDLNACLAPHLPPLTDEAKPLLWHASQQFARFSVLAWTCSEHRETWYELCSGGGMAYIRRMSGDPVKPEVSQTHAWTMTEAREVWAALLSGHVR